MEHHVVPVKTYASVFAALVALLVLTVGASYVDFGPFNIVVAMVIAITKAVMVVLIFMGVKYGTRLIWMWAAVGFLWFLIMFTILTDYVTRGTVTGW
jgi:cytochrome c oxidase subunit 4